MRARSKYRAVRTSCGLHEHASKKEAKVCVDLQLMQKGGAIHNLKFQVPFKLWAFSPMPNIPASVVSTYIADFVYDDLDSTTVLDVKGFRTPLYRMKKRWMKACWGIEVQEG